MLCTHIITNIKITHILSFDSTGFFKVMDESQNLKILSGVQYTILSFIFLYFFELEVYFWKWYVAHTQFLHFMSNWWFFSSTYISFPECGGMEYSHWKYELLFFINFFHIPFVPSSGERRILQWKIKSRHQCVFFVQKPIYPFRYPYREKQNLVCLNSRLSFLNHRIILGYWKSKVK